ncbi:Tetratricopeptide repeat protein 39B [Halotydeus destructor]|nr:Tetratricopeptide repeat protein 39B [Halotydeus destructor]
MDTVMIEPLTTGDKVVNNNDSTDYLDSQLKIAQHEEDSDACFDEYQYGDGDDGQGCPDLDTSMKECLEIFRLYLNNRFEEANKMASKWEKHSIYYTLIKSLMSFLPAFLMIEKAEVESCRRQLSRSLSLVNRKRKQNSIVESLSSFMWKVNYDDFTEEEVHAELIFAEIKLFYMMLAFVEK